MHVFRSSIVASRAALAGWQGQQQCPTLGGNEAGVAAVEQSLVRWDSSDKVAAVEHMGQAAVL